jgi:alpha-tubulin suppressor-like RCC1 family protein
MKRFIALAAAVCLTASAFTGCSDGEDKDEEKGGSAGKSAAVEIFGTTADTVESSFCMGNSFAFVIDDSGDLYGWGSATLNDGGDEIVRNPKKLLSDVRFIDASTTVCAAITENDELYVWGDGYARNSYNPTPLKALDNIKTVNVDKSSAACGYVAVTNDGELYYYTADIDVLNGIDEQTARDNIEPRKLCDNVTFATLNSTEILYLNDSGDLIAYGPYSNRSNPKQCYAYNDDGTVEKRVTTSIGDPVTVMSNVRWVDTSQCGEVFAITNDDELYVYGFSAENRLNEPVDDDLVCEKPTKIMDDVALVSNYGTNTAIVTKKGDLYINSTTHITMSDVAYAYRADACTYAINNDGALYKIGIDDEREKLADDIVSVKGNSYSATIVDKNGAVYTIGENEKGMLGSDKFEITTRTITARAGVNDIELDETNSTDEPFKLFDKIKTGG